MKRLASLLFPALLAAAAVVAHLPRLAGEPARDLFAQGALAPLVEAEKLLAEGKQPEALALFHLAAQRALKERQTGVRERIRLRIAAVGVGLSEISPEEGWPYLSLSCVMAPDFLSASERAEAWLLERGLTRPKYEYALMKENGRETVWGGRPERAPLFLFRRLDPGRPLSSLNSLFVTSWNDRQSVGDLPHQGRYAHGYRTWVFVRRAGPFPQVRVEAREPASVGFCVSMAGSIEWESVARAGMQENSVQLSPGGQGYLDRIVVVGDGPPPAFRAVIVKEYEALR